MLRSPMLALLAFLPAIAYSASPQEIARKTFPSVVLLVMKDRHGQPVSMGSGFFVAKNTIATNLHVVRGASSGHAKIIGQNATISIEGYTAIDERLDLALLRASVDAPAVPIVTGMDVEIGETVFVIGNPHGLEGTFSQGIISGIRPVSGTRLIQITAPISPGSSGGPVLNSRGEVIGVAVATLKGGQNLNFAVAAEALSRILASQGAPRPLSAIALAPSQARIESKSATDKNKPERKESKSIETEERSILSGVVGHSFSWREPSSRSDNGDFGFSIQNKLSVPIADVKGVLVFFAANGLPLHYHEFSYEYPIISPGLATRIQQSTPADIHNLAKRVEIRVLDFLPLHGEGECEYLRRMRTRYTSVIKQEICKSVKISLQNCEKCAVD